MSFPSLSYGKLIQMPRLTKSSPMPYLVSVQDAPLSDLNPQRAKRHSLDLQAHPYQNDLQPNTRHSLPLIRGWYCPMGGNHPGA